MLILSTRRARSQSPFSRRAGAIWSHQVEFSNENGIENDENRENDKVAMIARFILAF